MRTTQAQWEQAEAYIHEVFGREDEQMTAVARRAAAAGLPGIAVSAEVGGLLRLLASLTQGRLALEFGTLGGYSGAWILRGLGEAGRLVTVEPDAAHAAVAMESFRALGVADRVELVPDQALRAAPGLRERFGDGAFDLVFLDAIKTEYPAYLEAVRPMLAPGGLLVADNTLGSDDWSAADLRADGTPAHPSAAGVDRFNRTLADDPDFDAAMVPLRHGLLVARKKS